MRTLPKVVIQEAERYPDQYIVMREGQPGSTWNGCGPMPSSGQLATVPEDYSYGIEVPDELVERWRKARAEYDAVQNELENYR